MTAVNNLDTLLAAQDALIRHDQLTAAGVTRAQLRRQLGTGGWRVLLPSVYLAAPTAAPTPTPRQRLLAASLYAGRDAQLTGAEALRLYGFHHLPHDPCVRVLVPHHRQVPSTGFVRVHRTRRPDPHARPWGFARVCGVARAVADAARWCATPRAVQALVAEALHRQLTTVERLRHELERGPRAGTALLRRALDDLVAAQPLPEAALRAALSASSILPSIRWNPPLVGLPDRRRLPRPDGWIEEAGLALEVDSAAPHLGPDGWEHAARRRSRLAEYGVRVLYFPPDRLRDDPSGVCREVERAYLDRLSSCARAAVAVDARPRAGRDAGQRPDQAP